MFHVIKGIKFLEFFEYDGKVATVFKEYIYI
jgi:hypothetical protein